MANQPQITIRNGATGKVTLINGKTYTLLRHYAHSVLDGVFFLAVAGRVPLKADDLAEHWQVLRSGHVYLARNTRPFSYHLIAGDGATTNTPRWPRLKASAPCYAFVGPTEEAAKTQIALTVERYHAKLTPEEALERITAVPDLCGGPSAYLLRADRL